MSITIGNWYTGIYRSDLNISKGREKEFERTNTHIYIYEILSIFNKYLTFNKMGFFLMSV